MNSVPLQVHVCLILVPLQLVNLISYSTYCSHGLGAFAMTSEQIKINIQNVLFLKCKSLLLTL